MNQLTEYYKIIQHFTSLYAGEGDDELAQQAVDAITPVAEKGNTKAQYMLGRYYSWGYHHQCDNQKAIYWFEKAADKGSDKAAEALANLYRYDFGDDEMISAQAKKDFVHKWHYRWIEILEAKATKGVASAAQALMKLYVYDCPEDIDREEGVKIACKWYYRWVEILKTRADKGDMATKSGLPTFSTGVRVFLMKWWNLSKMKTSTMMKIPLPNYIPRLPTEKKMQSLGSTSDCYIAVQRPKKIILNRWIAT